MYLNVPLSPLGHQVDPVALADMVTSGRTLDLSAVVLDAQFKEAIEWVGIHQLFRGSVVVDAGTVSSLPFGGLIYQVGAACVRCCSSNSR